MTNTLIQLLEKYPDKPVLLENNTFNKPLYVKNISFLFGFIRLFLVLVLTIVMLAVKVKYL